MTLLNLHEIIREAPTDIMKLEPNLKIPEGKM